jgi:RNA polymerase sigma-70 factor (ECF subfamily)
VDAVAGSAKGFREFTGTLRPVVVNGGAGVVVATRARTFCLMAFTVSNGRITEVDVLIDPDRLAALGIG